MKQQTVFVVDDDAAVRDGLAVLLESAGHRTTVFENAEGLLEQVDTSMSGCLILDLDLPGLSGSKLQQTLLERQVRLPIIFLSGHGDIPSTVRAMKAGAENFLTKPVDGGVLLDCVQDALAVDAQRQAATAHRIHAREVLARLSDRERDVLALAIQGLSNKEIGKALQISHRTVEVHRGRIFLKTGTSTLLELSALTRLAGLRHDD
jgi:FixJ family two-component response regulator